MKKKIRFIINPRSGVRAGIDLPALIEATIDKNIFDAEIIHTLSAGHGEELSADAVSKNYFAAVAVGGDGSVQDFNGNYLDWREARQQETIKAKEDKGKLKAEKADEKVGSSKF